MSLNQSVGRFDRLTNSMSFTSKELNYWYTSEYYDNSNVYQKKYNVFGKLRFTKQNTFKISSIESSPLLWQPHNSCSFDPIGKVTIGQIDLTPDRVKVNAEQCYDELFDSCFGHLLDWNGTDVNWRNESAKMLQAVIMQLLKSSAYGFRGLLAGGRVFGTDVEDGTISYLPEVSNSIQDAFGIMHDASEGWLALANQLAIANPTKYGHLNIAGVIDPNDCTVKGRYDGGFEVIANKVMAAAPDKLHQVIDEGGIMDGGSTLRPVYIASPGIFRAMVQEMEDNDAQPMQNKKAITVVEGPGGVKFYSIKGIPVIPDRYGCFFDKYVNATTHYLYLTATSNIQLGSSYSDLPDPTRAGSVSAVIKKYGADNIALFGKMQLLMHALIKVAIADHELMAGTQEVINHS